MNNEYVITSTQDGDLALRTVVVEESETATPMGVLTATSDGKPAIRVAVAEGGGDQHNLGWYATESALTTAHPTATDGDWAIVGATDTVWIWDSDTTAWVDSDQKGQVTSVNGSTGDVTITAASLGAATQTPTTATLVAASWVSDAQTVSVSGVTAGNTILVSPAPASATEYGSCGVICTAQASGTLTFECTTTPTNDLTVNLVILN